MQALGAVALADISSSVEGGAGRARAPTRAAVGRNPAWLYDRANRGAARATSGRRPGASENPAPAAARRWHFHWFGINADGFQLISCAGGQCCSGSCTHAGCGFGLQALQVAPGAENAASTRDDRAHPRRCVRHPWRGLGARCMMAGSRALRRSGLLMVRTRSAVAGAGFCGHRCGCGEGGANDGRRRFILPRAAGSAPA